MTDENNIGLKVLALPMQENDAGEETVKGYLVALLWEVWANGEGFSGKRPFGNSGWEYDLYRPLVASGIASGTIDEYGDMSGIDKQELDALIFAAIEDL